MTALDLLAEARRRDIRLAPRGERLGYDAPPGALTPEFRSALAVHKAELLALLAPGETPSPLADRWGPSLDHDEPSIVIPADSWRWTVANWPHERWAAWRRRAGELEPPDASAEQIRVAERLAYQEMTRAPEPLP